jgi:O-antigen/teichoic acid export membrane protein
MNRTLDAGEGEAIAAQGLAGTVMRGVAVAGGGYALTQILTGLTYIVLARLATPTEFGQLAAGTILVGVAGIFTESGMLSALIYRRDRLEEAAATGTVSTILGGIAFSLISLALAPVIGAVFHSSTVTGVAAAVSGLAFLHTSSVVADALMQRRFSFVRRTIVEPAAIVAFGVTAVVLTASGLGVWGLVLGQYAGALVQSMLSWILARWRPNLRLASYAMWRELISYGRHTIVATGIIRVGEQVPVVLLGRFTGTSALGQFQYGGRVATLPLSMIMAAGSYVLFPALARIATERERFLAGVQRAFRWMAVVATFGGLILLPLGKPFVVLVFGSVWGEAGNAAMALAFFIVARAMASLLVETVKAHGRPDIVVRMNALEVCVDAVAMVALLSFGLVGICIGLTIGAVVRAGYAIHRVDRVVGLRLRVMLEAIGPALIAGLVMVAILLPLETLVVHAADHGTLVGLVLLALEGMGGLAIYGAALHLLVPGTIGELVGLVKTMRRHRSEGDAL